MSNSPYRSFERITLTDLERLAELANATLHGLFQRRRSGVYTGRCFLMCLCQGAAQHFVHGDRGVQDFDVWAFFRPHPDMAFPPRWRGEIDFGPSRFGRNPDDGARFSGRRVDVMGRSISALERGTAVDTVQRYLREGRTNSARHLAQRPVVALWPEPLLGTIIWPPADQPQAAEPPPSM